jgi:type II secretory pathway pseudopilin PulG
VKAFAAQMRESANEGQTMARRRPREEGYILLTLLLVVSLMVIFSVAALPAISYEIRRDREQEMIHRGVQYSRAIRGYYKKFGRYPTRLEDLENTNNLRYLRKRYKDPLNCTDAKCQDFKLLHFGDPGVTIGGGGLSFGGGSIPGASAVGSPAGGNGASQNSSGFGGSSFGGSSFGGSSSGTSGFGGSGSGNSGVNSSGVFAQSSGFGGNANSGNSNSGFGASSNSQTPSGQQGTNAAPGSDSTQASSQETPGKEQGDSSSGSQQPIASGPIVGVASVIKKPTIREFNKKKKYNEWQFLYDPSNEPRSGLITTPNQPLLQGVGMQPLQNGQPAGASSSSFGQPTGLNNNSNPMAAPAQPPSNPPQPQ